MSNPVEIVDYKSKAFGNVLVYGREYQLIGMTQEYTPLQTHYRSPYHDAYGYNCQPIPDIKVALTLRLVPSPPPPAPKRTWSSAMGLRRPKR